MIIAHKDENGREQSLFNHLINVGNESFNLGKQLDIEYISLIVGLLHDLGKADPLFQDKIMNNKNTSVNHSSAGAKYLYQIYCKVGEKNEDFKSPICQSYAEILMYAVEAHHGVFDIGTYNKQVINSIYQRIEHYTLNRKYRYDLVKDYANSINEYCNKSYKLSLKEIFKKGLEEYSSIIENLDLKKSKNSKVDFNYYNHCIIRLILSILKNEDIYDTINAYEKIIDKRTYDENQAIIEYFYQQIEAEYGSYPPPISDINKVRASIVDVIRTRYDTDSNGIYKLDLPTGAGKTKLSLLYSLHQMKNNHKNKMIYIAPFLSILEQNAYEYRKTLANDKYILEHHSNVVDNNHFDSEDTDDDNIAAMKEYIKESWDQIVILSTMVQFSNTLFKSRSSNLRRFYNLSNSVIILDEVQSLPDEMIHIFNLMLNFISKVMNSVIILCSATQPSLDHDSINHKIIYGGSNNEDYNLIQLDDRQKQIFDRVDVSLLNNGKESRLTDIYNSVLGDKQKSTLIILNTKKSVMNLYEMFEDAMDDTSNLYYLTTNMCPKHRLDIINEIKDKLNSDIDVIVISTSLIEAGVNLDFRRLYRSYAGFDSIIQAMGRCNREGKYDKGEAYLVNLDKDDEKLGNLKSIENKKNMTKKILDNYDGNFDIEELNKRYYAKLFSNLDDLDKKLADNKTLLDLLSFNKEIRQSGDMEGINAQALKEASDQFSLIEDDSESVIVYYGESYTLIEELIAAIEEFRGYDGNKEKINEIKILLNKLQPYTISIYNSKDFEDKLVKVDGLDAFGIKILNESNYDEKVGLTEESKLESFMIWYTK